MDDLDAAIQGQRPPNKRSGNIATLQRLLIVVLGCVVLATVATVLSEVSRGLGSVSISLAVTKRAPAGSAEKLRVTMTSEHGGPVVTSLSWGDGGEEPKYSGFCIGGGPVDGSKPEPLKLPVISSLPPTQTSVYFVHRYRRPGTYRVTVHAIEYSFCTGPTSPTKDGPSGGASILIRVPGPVAPGNGPTEPRPGLKLKLYDYYERLSGYFGADDSDGYLRSMTVTWVDGNTHVYNNATGCADHDDIWPSGLTGFRWRQRVKPGTYTVKITALSTDCAGGESQMTTLVVTFRLARTGDRIQVIKSTFTPHMPNGNGDISLPISEEEGLGVFESVP